MLTPGKKSLELLDTLTQVGDSLQKITDNPEGGTLTIDIQGTGKRITFTMPPKNKRKKLI